MKNKIGWDKECWQYQCSDGFHPSFWKTVVESPQWKEWYKEQHKRFKIFTTTGKELPVFDIDESQECGWLGALHFQEFIKFVIGKK